MENLSESMDKFVTEHTKLTEPICRALCIRKKINPDGAVSGHAVVKDGEVVKTHVSHWPPLWFTFDEEVRTVIAAFLEVAANNLLISEGDLNSLVKKFKLKEYVSYNKEGKVIKSVEDYNEFFKGVFEKLKEIGLEKIGDVKFIKRSDGFLETEDMKKEREWFDSHTKIS